MNSIIKKSIFLLLALLVFNSCIVQNPKPEDCEIIEITVSEIFEGTSNDIVLKDNGTDYFYINSGLERGLSVTDLSKTILNKKVTLHLPKLPIIQSENIAQIAIGEEVIFTEFN